MPKYYDTIEESTDLTYRTSNRLGLSSDFYLLGSYIVSNCSYLQSLLQGTIYISHGAELDDARRVLNGSPNPRARFDFLCSFPFPQDDPTISVVFEFARDLFKDIYEFRNILSHEIWSCSDQYPNEVLFSTLDSTAKLSNASGDLVHKEGTAPQETLNAIIRFIRSMKRSNIDHFEKAAKDIDLCNWALMTIGHFLKEQDSEKKKTLRDTFYVFEGTSHLFEGKVPKSKTVSYSSGLRIAHNR